MGAVIVMFTMMQPALVPKFINATIGTTIMDAVRS